MSSEANYSFSDFFKTSSSSKTSVIIPCHNYGKFLSWTLMSVLHQTHPPKEIIVIDDSSTDDTQEVASSFKDTIRYFYVDFKCAQQTRNFGLSQATGDYICFLDADDFFDNYALEILESELESDSKLKLVYSGLYQFGSYNFIKEKKFKFHIIPNNFDLDRLHQYNYIPMPSLFRKTGFPGFDPKIERFQDWDAWLSFLSSNTDAKCIPFPLHHHRFHGKNKTLTINFHSARFKVLAKHQLLKPLTSVNKKSLITSKNNKAFIIALDININNASLLIEFLTKNSEKITGIIIHTTNKKVNELINSSLLPDSLYIRFESQDNLDQLIKLALLCKSFDKSEWFIISKFSSPILLENFIKYKDTSNPLIESTPEIDWSLGLRQKSFIALNKKASQLTFSISPKKTNMFSIFKYLRNYTADLWGKHIGWRFNT